MEVLGSLDRCGAGAARPTHGRAWAGFQAALAARQFVRAGTSTRAPQTRYSVALGGNKMSDRFCSVGKLFVFAALGLAFSGSGCERKVPDDIVQKSMQGAFRQAPNTASAMCGVPVKGFSSVEVKVTKRSEKNTGVAHIVGKPWLGTNTPKQCEGDVEYAYSYSSKTSRTGRRRRTTVTWSLDQLKLVAVQTPGVTFKPVQESPPEADDGDDEKGAEK